ncbi:response regulator [Oculatella sp. LEGE 06141]|uniref:response regulator n=1 Tax=Oculatella sp. LEGE 06141 TaxID=1828648 RepID=UPI00187FE6F0|nr:response regulator [Oculatella sp. LEGE 06141]MBE9181859.1 response regulator [Oculatella sp. LEGE 06141]
MNVSHPASNRASDRILVVDDLIDNSFLLQTLLEEMGYQVDVADSGSAALAKVEENPPDLILLDVMMPEMSGYEVTQRIRQNPDLPPIPIILVTGYTQPSPEDALDCGANGLIRKPIDFDEVVHWVRHVLPVEASASPPAPDPLDGYAPLSRGQMTREQFGRQFSEATPSRWQY